MGCGISQISPLDSAIVNHHQQQQQQQQQFSKPWNNIQLFLSRRNNNKNEDAKLKPAQVSQLIQTDDDIFGFKCQHCQTDSNIMSEEEFECMILALQEAQYNDNKNNNVDQNDKNHNMLIITDEEEHDDTILRITSSGSGIRQRFAIAHASVQATSIKRDKSNQTKFGSIDHRFNVSQNPSSAEETEKVLDQLIDIIEQDSKIEKEQTNKSDKERCKLSARTRLKDIGKKLCLQGKQDEQFQFCLESIMGTVRAPKKRDVELQTVNDILTDESPIYAARPPLRLKHELIASSTLFRELDRKIESFKEAKTLPELVRFIMGTAKNELFRIRAAFIWVTGNICHAASTAEPDRRRISSEVLQTRYGNSYEFASLFADIGRSVGFRVKILQGFIKGPSHPAGYEFHENDHVLEYWNMVFVSSSWRAINCFLAAGQLNHITEEFQVSRNELYFLTDSTALIWSHFPYSKEENNYERWQLLDRPLSLNDFNSLPKVTDNFFEYNLTVRSRLSGPWVMFRVATEIKIGSLEPMRYKFKLYHANQSENASLNHYVFCQLKEERLVGSFMVSPPVEGHFFLKIFGRPEREMYETEQDLQAVLPPILTFALNCTKAKKYIEPYPLNDLPWGQTQKFYDYRLKLVNQKGPIVVTWGGRRRLVFEAVETMLFTMSLFDSESEEIDIKDIIVREDNGLKTTFSINPPRMGTFRLMLYGMPKPKQKGKWRLPLLGSFMIDCKLTKLTNLHEDNFQPTAQLAVEKSTNADDKKK